MSSKTFVYVSSWAKASDGTDRFGIVAYRYDRESGELQWIEAVEPKLLFNVTCFDKSRGILYALNEENDLPGLRGGGGGRVLPSVWALTPEN